MTKIHVTFQEKHISGGGVSEGEENDDWPSHDNAYYDFEVLGAFEQLPSVNEYFSYESFDSNLKAGTTAYVVVVRYADGDTFHHNSGKGGIAGIFATDDEAKALAKSIRDDTFSGYKFWDDYFGGLESVSIEQITVKEK